MDWIKTIFSEVNSEMVSNPYPRFGETVTVKIRFSRDSPVEEVFLKEITQGTMRRTKMNRLPSGAAFTWYSGEIVMDSPRIEYSFELKVPEGFYFYSQKQVTRFHQTEDNGFVIIADFDNPRWVPGAVFYQIFPDRFRKGDDTVGVKEGEYSFDGGTTQVIPWGEVPPEFAESRCLDFYNGDLKGVKEAIPYFKSLGVNALYLNPIFSAKTNHRYDCTDYFHVDAHLGGDAALAELMEALHEAGIRAIVDVSINHTGIEHTWFKKALADPGSKEAGYYYRNEDAAPDDPIEKQFVYWWDVPTLPQLNYGNEELRDRIWRDEDSLVKKFLLPPYKIDGWRFDVASQVGRHKKDQFCHEIWREVRNAVKQENDQAYIIGEHWEDHISYILGDQWDGAMNYFGSGRLLRSWAGELDRFLNTGWGHSPEEGGRITGNELADVLRERISRMPNQLAFRTFNLLNSHDTPRFHHNEELYDWDIYRGMIMLMFLLPGAVNYFYGDEIGITGHVHSVEGSRYSMVWDPEKQDRATFDLYSRLGNLKSREAALGEGGWKVLSSDSDLLIFSRFFQNTGYILLLNREEKASSVSVPGELLGVVSTEDVFTGEELPVNDGSFTAELSCKESRLFRCTLEL